MIILVHDLKKALTNMLNTGLSVFLDMIRTVKESKCVHDAWKKVKKVYDNASYQYVYHFYINNERDKLKEFGDRINLEGYLVDVEIVEDGEVIGFWDSDYQFGNDQCEILVASNVSYLQDNSLLIVTLSIIMTSSIVLVTVSLIVYNRRVNTDKKISKGRSFLNYHALKDVDSSFIDHRGLVDPSYTVSRSVTSRGSHGR
jgi:hypothetical protein